MAFIKPAIFALALLASHLGVFAVFVPATTRSLAGCGYTTKTGHETLYAGKDQQVVGSVDWTLSDAGISVQYKISPGCTPGTAHVELAESPLSNPIPGKFDCKKSGSGSSFTVSCGNENLADLSCCTTKYLYTHLELSCGSEQETAFAGEEKCTGKRWCNFIKIEPPCDGCNCDSANNKCFPKVSCGVFPETCTTEKVCEDQLNTCVAPTACPSGSCTTDPVCSASECQAPFSCPEGSCTTDPVCSASECQAPFACPEGSCTTDPVCAASECQAPFSCPEGSCTTDPVCAASECQAPFSCPEGSCTTDPVCAASECQAPFSCPEGSCTTDPVCAASECQAPFSCPEGSCTTELVCSDSQCQPCPITCPPCFKPSVVGGVATCEPDGDDTCNPCEKGQNLCSDPDVGGLENSFQCCPPSSNCKLTVITNRLNADPDTREVSFVCSSNCGGPCDSVDNMGKSNACSLYAPLPLGDDGDPNTDDILNVCNDLTLN